MSIIEPKLRRVSDIRGLCIVRWGIKHVNAVQAGNPSVYWHWSWRGIVNVPSIEGLVRFFGVSLHHLEV